MRSIQQGNSLLGKLFRQHLLSPNLEAGNRDAIAWLTADGLRKQCNRFNLK
ncbi:hypothetical protein [Coleofasciculus sp.]|uniref:hypothetical protein n=1 Tax=Coleofasciculus sp. TaxID=3100458 RepID=UPI0039F9957B